MTLVIGKNVSAKIFVDAKYFGRCFHRARSLNKAARKNMAKKLGMTDRELLQIECGRAIMPKNTLIKLFRIAIGFYDGIPDKRYPISNTKPQ